VILNGNINRLFLLNLGDQKVELSGDNSVALNLNSQDIEKRNYSFFYVITIIKIRGKARTNFVSIINTSVVKYALLLAYSAKASTETGCVL
jgi:hypothetical protein